MGSSESCQLYGTELGGISTAVLRLVGGQLARYLSPMRCAAVVLMLLEAACTSPPTYPGSIVLGTLQLRATLQTSTCAFDAWTDGGGSPAGLTLLGVASVSPARDEIYLSWNGLNRSGGLMGPSFDLDSVVIREACNDYLDQLDEHISAQFYGPPIAPNTDGGCILLFGPGRFPDAGPWLLSFSQLPDGGSADGGALDGGISSCFVPQGLLDGQLQDLFTVVAGPDGGINGDLCNSRPDGGPVPDSGASLACAATYSLQGTFQP
jgi:hypothetical protein